MRSVGFSWILFLVTFLPAIFNSESAFINDDDVAMATNHGGHTMAMTNRKLKERNFEVGKSLKNRESESINEEDYPSFDPSPSSKAAIHSGPIEHGTPLMPYIPRPTPPANRPCCNIGRSP